MEKDIEIFNEINQVAHMIKRGFHKNVSFDENFGMAEIRIIKYMVKHNGEGVFQKDIESKYGLRPSSVSVVVRKLEDKGLITKKTSEKDRRLKELVFTDKAMEIHKNCYSQAEGIEAKLHKEMTAEEINELYHLLEKVKTIIEGEK